MAEHQAKALYLVTGACGHLGNTIVKMLVRQGEEVRAFALPSDSDEPLKALQVPIFRGDVRELSTLEPFFKAEEEQALIVIHAAGIVSIASRFNQEVFDVNVRGTRNILRMCKKHHAARLVYVSSVHAIPEQPGRQMQTEPDKFDPLKVEGLYARTKAQAAASVLRETKWGLNGVVVMPSGIIGPGDYGRGHLTQLIMDYLDGRLAACVAGGYDFVDVRDVAAGVIAAATNGRTGESYILSGHYSSIPDLLNLLHEISGKKPVRTVLPTWFARLTAPLAEMYYKALRQPPLYTPYSLYTLSANGCFSHKKASAQLGYASRPLRETLADTVKWLSDNGRLKRFHSAMA